MSVFEEDLYFCIEKWLKDIFNMERTYRKVQIEYPDGSGKLEVDVLGIGMRNKIIAIEVKLGREGFFREFRQAIGYPFFFNEVYFAQYFRGEGSFTSDQKAEAARHGIGLLKITRDYQTRSKKRELKYKVDRVNLRGGSKLETLRINFIANISMVDKEENFKIKLF